MFRVHEGNLSPPLLSLSQNVQGQRGFAGGLRAVNLNDSSLGHSADAQGSIQGQGAGGNRLHVHLGPVAQAHNGALAEALVDLCQSSLQCLFLIGGGGGGFISGLFRCHNLYSFPAVLGQHSSFSVVIIPFPFDDGIVLLFQQTAHRVCHVHAKLKADESAGL